MRKKSWPELLGTNGEEAVQLIKKETGLSRRRRRRRNKSNFFSFLLGFIDVQIHRQGSPMTMDVRTNHVRVIVDSNGLVSTIPSIA